MAAHLDEATYLAERVDASIAWHSRQDRRARRLDVAFSAAVIVASAVAAWLTQRGGWADLSSGLSVGVVILSGLSSLGQFRQRWVQYQGIAAALRAERWLYQTGCADGDFRAFVRRVEGILAGAARTTGERVSTGERT